VSANVYILVQFTNGKPSLTLGPTPTVRSYTRKGSAENYAEELAKQHKWLNERAARLGREVEPPLDIRILSVAIPDEGPVGDGMWPDIIPQIAIGWS
jgi:hypothetical protein